MRSHAVCGRRVARRTSAGVLVAGVAALALAAGACDGTSHGAAAAGLRGSGIRGHVLYGPTCPVERAGQTCERPYRALLSFRRQPANRTVARVRSSASGYFSVALAPGHYVLAPRNAEPFPHSAPLRVTVSPGRYTSVTVRYDSGIR
jgi:hypothetical protein